MNRYQQGLSALCLALLTLGSWSGQAAAQSVTVGNNTPGIADNSGGERTANVNQSFAVTDVNITIEFAKCNDTADLTGCTNDNGGGPFFNEIFFGLKDPSGAVDIELVPFGTWNSGSSPIFQDSITLDDAAADPVNIDPNRPVTGTFRPVNALSAFNGVDSLGDWTLTFADNSSSDPLVFLSYTLTLIGPGGSVPLPATLLLVPMGVAGMAWMRRRRSARAAPIA
jgi:hypothetical protein